MTETTNPPTTVIEADNEADLNLQFDPESELEISSTAEQITAAEAQSKIETRKALVQAILPYFKLATGTVISIVAIAFIADCLFLTLMDDYSPEDRIIDGNVVMSLIGATVVQIGAVVYLSGKWVFEPNK